jgi:hypothetical protein
MMSAEIVEEILHELKGRKGFDWWWEEMDEDIQQEIKGLLVVIIDQGLGKK